MATQQAPDADTGLRKSLKNFFQATKTFWTGSSKPKTTVVGKDVGRGRPSTIHDLDESRPPHSEHLPGGEPGRNLTSARSVPLLRTGAEVSGSANGNATIQGGRIRNVRSTSFEPTRGSDVRRLDRSSEAQRMANKSAVRAHQELSATRSVPQGTTQPGIASSQVSGMTGWQTQSGNRNQAPDRVQPMASIPEPIATPFLLASDFNQAPRSNTIGSGPTRRRESGILFPGTFFSSAPRSLEMPARQQSESLESRPICRNIPRDLSPRTRVSARQSMPSLPRGPTPSQEASTRSSRPLPNRYNPTRPNHMRPMSSTRNVRTRALTTTGHPADSDSRFPAPHQVGPPRFPSSNSTLQVDTAYSSYANSPNAEAMHQSRMSSWPPSAALANTQIPDAVEHRDSVLESFRWPWHYHPAEHMGTYAEGAGLGRAVSISGASFVTASPNAVSRIGTSVPDVAERDEQDEQTHDSHSCWCEDCFEWRMKYRFSHHAVGQRLRHVEALYQEYGDNLRRVFQIMSPECEAELSKLQHMAVTMKGKRTFMRSITDEDKEFSHMAARLARLESDMDKANVNLLRDLRAVGKKASKEQRTS